MVNRVRNIGHQSRPQTVSMKVGDEMIGSLHLRESRRANYFGEKNDFFLVRVKGGIMGFLVGKQAELDALDPNLRVKVRLKRIDEADAAHPRTRYVFELLDQKRPSIEMSAPVQTVPAKSEAGRITDKAIPPVAERVAFRNFGHGILKTNSRDKDQLWTLTRDWLKMAKADLVKYSISLVARQGEVIDLAEYRHYENLYDLAQRLTKKLNGWQDLRDDFIHFVRLPSSPTAGTVIKIFYDPYRPYF